MRNCRELFELILRNFTDDIKISVDFDLYLRVSITMVSLLAGKLVPNEIKSYIKYKLHNFFHSPIWENLFVGDQPTIEN